MLDPKRIQINLTGFLAKNTPAFMSALWNLLLEAQSEITGVPRTFLEQKKEEMRKARETDGRAIDERDRRARLDEINNDRGGYGGDRGRGGARGRGGGGRGRGGGGGRPSRFDDGPPGPGGMGRSRDSGWGGRGGGPPVRFANSIYMLSDAHFSRLVDVRVHHHHPVVVPGREHQEDHVPGQGRGLRH